jgi:hypothetical protein
VRLPNDQTKGTNRAWLVGTRQRATANGKLVALANRSLLGSAHQASPPAGAHVEQEGPGATEKLGTELQLLLLLLFTHVKVSSC